MEAAGAWKQNQPCPCSVTQAFLWLCFPIYHLRVMTPMYLGELFSKWPIKVNVKHCADKKSHMDASHSWLSVLSSVGGMPEGGAACALVWTALRLQPGLSQLWRRHWQLHGHPCRVRSVLCRPRIMWLWDTRTTPNDPMTISIKDGWNQLFTYPNFKICIFNWLCILLVIAKIQMAKP